MSSEQEAVSFFDQENCEEREGLTEENLLVDLNPPQQEAVLHGDGPILVLAGAGSGKTKVLTHRVAHLVGVKGVFPDRILAVTFTNKASEEMRTRLRALLGEKAKQLWMSTFHSVGLRILRHNATRLSYTNRFVVYDDQDTKGVLKEILKELKIDDEKYPLNSFMHAIDQAKNKFEFPEDLAERSFSTEAEQQAQVYDKYQKKLLASDAMDFGDLLVNTVRILKEHPDVLDYYRRSLHYILVDEFQDTNKVQYMLIRLLAEPRRNLFVVGDDDQSIYAFRGATISNILEFERDFPNTRIVKLEQNYRSTGTILNAAHSVIERNQARKAKKLWTTSEAGELIRTFIGNDENEEANFIASEVKKLVAHGAKYSDIAILYRTNAQTRALEEAFVKMRVPYKIFGGLKFFDRKEIKDIIAYLRLLVNPADNQAFQRIINTPPRGIGAQALQAIVDEAERTSVPYLHASIVVAESNRNIHKFVELVADLKRSLETMPLGDLIEHTIKVTEYGQRLAVMKDYTAQARIENLQELVAIGKATTRDETSANETLSGFLDRISLTSSADEPTNESHAGIKNAAASEGKPAMVSLMTLHLAKGLEFPTVFLSGMEEGLLPHHRSLNSKSELEEERRLCYVGITRAMRVLYFTRAYQRGMFASGGSAGSMGGVRMVSRFIKDIPEERLMPVGTERSQGADFIDGFRRIELDEEDIDSYQERNFRRRKETPSYRMAGKVGNPFNSSPLSLDKIRDLLAPADKLPKNMNLMEQECEGKELAQLGDLTTGRRVIHPSFGYGKVETVEGAGPGAKISVMFDSYEGAKKLIFGFAKLVLG